MRLTALGIVLAVLLGGCTITDRQARSPAGGGPSGSAPAGQQARWTDCADQARELLGRKPNNVTYECATIKVPQDWTANPPNGKTFDIAMMRARASGQRDKIGSLVVNPGGPGGSGLQLAAYLSIGLPADITRRFDIVGFDPRGVGKSSPVECLSDSLLDRSFGAEPDPVSQADFDAAVSLAKQMGQDCAAKYNDTLPLFSTEQAARDMDAVRAATGDEKITYLGYSYGTLLGATYAQQFPKNIRALVLDGAIDPKQDFIASSEAQANGFERAFNNFSNWCKTSAGTCPIGPDARAAVTGVLDQARRSPVRGPDGRTATAGWISTAIISSLYSQQGWTQLAKAIADLRNGNARGVFQLADQYAERDPDGRYTNLFDANAAVNCGDTDQKITVEQVRTLQSQWRQKYPLFGAQTAIGLLTCAEWPGKRDPYPTGRAAGAPPILVVGTTGDPATPYEQTPKLAEMLGVGVVLTWQGEGHTAYPETRCITDAVNAYLIQLTVPGPGTTCPAK